MRRLYLLSPQESYVSSRGPETKDEFKQRVAEDFGGAMSADFRSQLLLAYHHKYEEKFPEHHRRQKKQKQVKLTLRGAIAGDFEAAGTSTYTPPQVNILCKIQLGWWRSCIVPGSLEVEACFDRECSLRDAQESLCGLFGKTFPGTEASLVVNQRVFKHFSDKPFQRGASSGLVVFQPATNPYFLDLAARSTRPSEGPCDVPALRI